MEKLKRGNAFRRHTITGLHTRPPIRLIRRFSSVEENYETERRKTISCYQRVNLEVNSFSASSLFQDEVDRSTKLWTSLEGYNLTDLYVNIMCTLFPQIQSGNKLEYGDFMIHLKNVFRLTDENYRRLLNVIKLKELPQKMVNLEIVEAKGIPPTDSNGSSDPFCVVFVHDRDVAQATHVIRGTLNPFWKKYFTLRCVSSKQYFFENFSKVNDPSNDVLHVEVMDFNEKTERLRDRVKGFKDLKSPGYLGVLLCEIANARSDQELIGSIKIPISDLRANPLEKWFGIEQNDVCRGKIFLRVALGYRKNRTTVFEEFHQILHLLVIYELDHGSFQEIPFYWDEHFEISSKRILRQLKWQGGLKSKDVVLAKWIIYTKVNSTFPLNANMMFLLMDDVMERVAKREYDTKQIPLLRDSTVLLVESIIKFMTNIHDLLSSDALLGHMKHMIKTLSLVSELLDVCSNCNGVMIPYSKSDLMERVNEALRSGSIKFYEKVLASSSAQHANNGQDPLYLTLQILLKTGYILNEDLRLSLKSIHSEFNTVLGIDYFSIVYQIYDEKFGKMVKSIMEQYILSFVFSDEKPSTENDEELDEESPSVKTAETVIQLYFIAKNLAVYMPNTYLDHTTTSEYSLTRYYNDWFFYGVAVWIDILRRRITKWVKNSITYSDLHENGDNNDVFYMNNNEQDMNVSCGTSALDTAEMFHAINQFWQSLGWQNPYQAFKIVRKLLEEIYSHLIYYAAQLQENIKTCKPPIHKQYDESAIFAYLNKSCMEVKNIYYVKNEATCLKKELKIDEIIEKIALSDSHSLKEKTEEYEQSITTISVDMEKQVTDVVENILKHCRKIILSKIGHLFNELCKKKEQHAVNAANRSREFEKLTNYIGTCIAMISENLETEIFGETLEKLWEEVLNKVNNFVDNGLEAGQNSDFFICVKNIITDLHAWLDENYLQDEGVKFSSPRTFEMFEKLEERLCNFQVPLTNLKTRYYEMRYKRQQLTYKPADEHGSLTVRMCYLSSTSEIVVEILNARNLKSYDSNNFSDPYATTNLIPDENFSLHPTFVTKIQYKTLFPLFDETFKFKLSKEECKTGFVLITLYDKDIFGSEYMGEVIFPLATATDVENEADLSKLPQNFIPICKPDGSDIEYLKKFEQRLWDKDAVKFARQERRKMK